ncbi:MAG: sigma-54 dependent transcriptional regulator [Flavobacteriaceae bacterium]|nr:sigma-54 dependent transcriptional regulator [Flavobacteriaceae bacterium]
MESSLQAIKQRFGIIGNDRHLNRSIEKSLRVASTNISVLVTGESGVGKENIPKIIHQLSHRKHANYIAVNCGAIPEGTIDSELFGHEKGAFTGATQTRKGYFEVADGGTIFLDEIGELPLTTQVRLLRVLENGEFIKVGSSKVQQTDVRIVAASNIDMISAIQNNKFREDLYYRLSTIEIHLPPLRERKSDIHLLFRKFASDFAQKYRMPTLRLEDDAVILLENYNWPGNIRQLRNIAEQISVIEKSRHINAALLKGYLPSQNQNLPAIIGEKFKGSEFANEREILYKILFDMRNDITDLKKLTLGLLKDEGSADNIKENQHLIKKLYSGLAPQKSEAAPVEIIHTKETEGYTETHFNHTETIEPTQSLQDNEIEMIKEALNRNSGKRKLAAQELGISERTLYRKIKQFDL